MLLTLSVITAVLIVDLVLLDHLLLVVMESSPWQCIHRSVLPIKHFISLLILNILDHLPLLAGRRWNLVAIHRLLLLLLTKTSDSLMNLKSLLCLQRRGAVVIIVLVQAAILLLTESKG